jgi:magnesium-transporting ATPase (P-type)
MIEVSHTGAHTEMGKIASTLSEKDALTPLQKQLNTFSSQLTWIVLIVSILVFVIGWFQ